MLTVLLRRRRRLVAGLVLAVLAVLGVSVLAFGGSPDLVVYNGRSQYSDEQSFTEFGKRTGTSLELRGGTAPELFERLRSEGADTPADLLVTTDLANLWRAAQAGLLAPVRSAALDRQVPAEYRDPRGAGDGLSLRHPPPVRSPQRVPGRTITNQQDLGDPRLKGRPCPPALDHQY